MKRASEKINEDIVKTLQKIFECNDNMKTEIERQDYDTANFYSRQKELHSKELTAHFIKLKVLYEGEPFNLIPLDFWLDFSKIKK